MTMSKSVRLSDFGIVPGRGFLPPKDPLLSLPSNWQFLDSFGKEIPDLIESGHIVEAAKDLPVPSPRTLSRLNQRERDRAMMIYGFGASAFVHSTTPPQTLLTRPLATPLYWLSKQFGKPPILSYCSYSLNNWQKIDPEKEAGVDNLKLLQNFIRLYDEDWFILIHVDIEQRASLAIEAAINAIHYAKNKKVDYLLMSLQMILMSLRAMIVTLKRMPEKCSPEIYFQSIRPWIKYFENVVYEGVKELNNEPQSPRGETGAQSSIMPLLEATFGLKHAKSTLTEHLKIMRSYMPLRHLMLIEFIERVSLIRQFVMQSGSKELKDAYNHCLERMFEFRDIHFGYATSYIHQKTTDPRGTGGTIFMPWLEQMRNETRELFLK